MNPFLPHHLPFADSIHTQSVACPSMPNYFIFTGPNATVGHGSLIYSLQWAADWMLRWVRKMLAEDIASVAPTRTAVDDFVRYGDQIMKRFVWTEGCKFIHSFVHSFLHAHTMGRSSFLLAELCV